ncbi:hypothetical protein ACRRTK_001855 [Alexandromys fortis]
MERQNFDYLLYVGLDDDDDNWDGQCVLGTVGWCSTSRDIAAPKALSPRCPFCFPLPEAEARRVLQAGEGRNEEASGLGQAGHGAAAAAAEADGAGEGAGEGEGSSAAGATGLMDDGNQEGAAGDHDKENEPQPQEPDRGAMGDNEGVLSLAERWSCVHPVRLLVHGIPSPSPAQVHLGSAPRAGERLSAQSVPHR